MITLDQAVELVWHALDDAIGGEIYIKKIPSMRVVDIAKAINPNARLEQVGIRPGEKLHEQMVGTEDAPYTYEYSGHYKILPAINDWFLDKRRIGAGTPVPDGFSYSSENNVDWMSIQDLSGWISRNIDDLKTT